VTSEPGLEKGRVRHG